MRRTSRLRATCVATLCLCGIVLGADGASNPLGGGGAVDLEAVPAPAAPRVSSRRIYTCVGGGGPVTFSDRPCGPSASVRDLPVVSASTDPAPDGASTRPLRGEGAAASGRARRDASPSRAASDTRDGRAADPVDAAEDRRGTAHDHRCENLREAVAALDQHMRAGYSAREAGRLWARWREAKERLRKSNC